MLDSQPWLAEALAASIERPLVEADLQRFVAAREVLYGGGDGALRPALRQLRMWTLCHLIVRDLALGAPLAEITETMTLLAEVALHHAHDVLRAALVERYGQPLSPTGWEQELLVVGMGKLGGRELNVSSDIDLIFIYPEDGDTGGRKSISNYEFFEKLGKQLIQALAEITEHGQVFRVDMRLRPNGDSGPLVCGFDMLENYFVTQGREWERYAWIKARVMLGARWPELEQLARPSCSASTSTSAPSTRCASCTRRSAARWPAATRQQRQARPRRHPRDRVHRPGLPAHPRRARHRAAGRPTLKVLALLPERGILSERRWRSCRRLRLPAPLEHRLQYLDDAQTHDLPEKDEDRALVAEAMGFTDYAALLEVLDAHREVVSQHFDSVFGDPSEEDHSLDATWANARDTEAATNALGELGYRHPRAAAERLAAMHASPRYRQLPNNIKSRFDALMPRVLEAAATTPGADDTLARMLDLLDAIGRRGAYLALLQQYPQALRRVADLMSASRWGAQFLTRHPILLDEMLDARNLDNAPDWKTFRASLARSWRRSSPTWSARWT
jgi:glutamate-ammonia-ligase adenylyltransferase